MSNLGRSIMPSFLSPMRDRRGTRHHRTPSSSSEASLASISSQSENQFVLSGCNTPAHEAPPAADLALLAAVVSNATGEPPATTAKRASEPLPRRPKTAATRDHGHYPKSTGDIIQQQQKPQLPAASPKQTQSRPIAIQLPPSRKIHSGSASTNSPLEPLSARGDIPGGYFPNHEDPKSRVHRPHPFHLDAKKARHRSLSQALESSSHPPKGRDSTASGGESAAAGTSAMSDPARIPTMALSPNEPSNPSSRSHTPVTSYLPNGVHNSPLPLGKYYPSNWERRNQGNAPQLRPSLSSDAKSEPNILSRRAESSHMRSDSDAKRRLQQYQRDMIAQATMAASQVLGGSGATAASRLGGAGLSNLKIGTDKPLSPRLIPMGSPGPVTPMELEGGGVDEAKGYLDQGRPLSGPDAVPAGDNRRLREGATSPQLKMNPVSF